jgi:murein DD-endopeptidase MepM/ murein hydrolase activator NlpD
LTLVCKVPKVLEMARSQQAIRVLTCLIALASSATAFFSAYEGDTLPLSPVLSSLDELPPLTPEIDATPIVEELPIISGDTLHDVLRRAAVPENTEAALVHAIRESMDVRKLRAGSSFQLTRTALGEPRKLEYQIDLDRILSIDISPGTAPEISPEIAEIPSQTEITPICATLEDSLFQSVDRVGERPELAVRMAEIFAWDLDFNTDPQPGDSFCLLVEKKVYGNGQLPTYGRILAANYVNMGKLYDAYLFEDSDGRRTYFAGDGKSSQAAFLRSPLRFAARISSGFSQSRLHPVLKIRRPHLGIDYAASTGTPVQAVSAGTVTYSGYSGGAGNLVRISHTNGYETYYMHLSKRSVRPGQKVSQGQQIGLVGSTGLSTGPHLDFRIKKNGKYLNFEAMKLSRESSLEGARLKQFRSQRDQYLAVLSRNPAMHGAVYARYSLSKAAATATDSPSEAY